MASPTASRREGPRPRLVAALAALAISATSLPAHAEGSALAQSLFDRARVLMDAGQFAEACPLLVESQRLDPGGGTLLNIAVCWEGAGKLATANEGFHEALGLSIRDQRADRKAIAEEHIAAIAPRLSTLVVDVPPAVRAPGLVVHVDGVELAAVAWGVPAAVDGGEHRIDASAPGLRTWTTTVQVGNEGDRARAIVPALPEATTASPLAPGAGAPRDDRVCPPGMRVAGNTCERLAPPVTHWSTATWVTGGVGLGLVALGAIAGGAALVQDGKIDDAANHAGCNVERDYCPQGADRNRPQDLADEAEQWGWVSTVAIGTGAAAMLVALLLPRDHETDAARPVAFVAPGAGGIGLRLRIP